MRYFLLDRVTGLEPEKKRATGIKCISLSDEVLHDHFQDYPIYPGTLLVEGLAQLAGLLLEVGFNEKTLALHSVLMQIDKMKFFKPSVPGDRLEYEAQIVSQLEDAARVDVQATSEGERRVRGRLNFAMVRMGSEALRKQRRDIYRIWVKGLPWIPDFL